MKLGSVFLAGAVGALLLGNLITAAIAAPDELRRRCPIEEITQANLLAAQVQELSKTDAAAALNIAEEVVRRRSTCFQVAFGAALDGTGTASIGRRAIPASHG